MTDNPPQHQLKLSHNNPNPIANKLTQIVLQYFKHFLQKKHIIPLQLFLSYLYHRYYKISKVLHTVLPDHQQVLF